ncbi:MAG: hypothetical protein H6739_17965 [Alphaproteobacteria bacterium]|nr:hypothetical protein [Alphaproteobacteria bacterium]
MGARLKFEFTLDRHGQVSEPVVWWQVDHDRNGHFDRDEFIPLTRDKLTWTGEVELLTPWSVDADLRWGYRNLAVGARWSVTVTRLPDVKVFQDTGEVSHPNGTLLKRLER